MVTNHAPQMKYSRNIITARRAIVIANRGSGCCAAPACGCSYGPSGAIFASQVLIRVCDIGDLSALAIVQNLLPLPRTQRDKTEQHCLGELRRILDRGTRV